MVMDAHRSVYPKACAVTHGDGPNGSAVLGMDVTSTDLRSWEMIVEELADSILWDRDFEMAEGFLDIDPGVSRQRRRLLGIDVEYFTRVAPDPRPEQAYQLASRTRVIVQSKPR